MGCVPGKRHSVVLQAGGCATGDGDGTHGMPKTAASMPPGQHLIKPAVSQLPGDVGSGPGTQRPA
jgi:hypothetical protein